MKLSSLTADKFAVGFSALCAIHCLALPLLLALIPSIAGLPLASESFHIWMVIAVIPTSIYALTLGCKKHQQKSILAYGVIGLGFLIVALTLGETLMGEFGEKFFTVLGALVIAFAHFKNYRLCQEKDNCECPSKKSAE